MSKFSERGYVVRENGPIYFTKDMDKTVKWFEGVLGWYGVVAGFMMVDGIDALHRFVKDNGWNHISEITSQPWGAKECRITTIDGCILRFFELVP